MDTDDKINANSSKAQICMSMEKTSMDATKPPMEISATNHNATLGTINRINLLELHRPGVEVHYLDSEILGSDDAKMFDIRINRKLQLNQHHETGSDRAMVPPSSSRSMPKVLGSCTCRRHSPKKKYLSISSTSNSVPEKPLNPSPLHMLKLSFRK
ncbi:hypothetical protein V6N13_058185 [Hibiscus sabdariffa]|uniref:Uncharacterized protein n=1 Tax=Hibiscus sabdariffa TaxID=183260 RepID=A0ABR2GHY1_9ROSI